MTIPTIITTMNMTILTAMITTTITSILMTTIMTIPMNMITAMAIITTRGWEISGTFFPIWRSPSRCVRMLRRCMS